MSWLRHQMSTGLPDPLVLPTTQLIAKPSIKFWERPKVADRRNVAV
jgi:hypothetical protein